MKTLTFCVGFSNCALLQQSAWRCTDFIPDQLDTFSPGAHLFIPVIFWNL